MNPCWCDLSGASRIKSTFVRDVKTARVGFRPFVPQGRRLTSQLLIRMICNGAW